MTVERSAHGRRMRSTLRIVATSVASATAKVNSTLGDLTARVHLAVRYRILHDLHPAPQMTGAESFRDALRAFGHGAFHDPQVTGADYHDPPTCQSL